MNTENGKMNIVVMRENDARNIEHARVIEAVKAAKRITPDHEKPSRELALALYCGATRAIESDGKFWFNLAEADGAISANDFASAEVLH